MQAEESYDYEPRCAILHDFCMQIPYSMAVMTSGVVLAVRGPPAAGGLMFAMGVIVAMCARTSLRKWKIGMSSSSSTWLCALVSGYLSWVWGAPALPAHLSMCSAVCYELRV